MKLTTQQIERVKSLEDSNGEVTAANVLSDARKRSSPLHGLIDWDKERAAEAYWLDCAREIIREVKVIVTTTTARIHVPYYVRNHEIGNAQGYRSVEALRRDPISARQSLVGELQRASGSLQRARMLAEGLGLSDEIDQLIAKVCGLQHQIYGESAPAPQQATM